MHRQEYSCKRRKLSHHQEKDYIDLTIDHKRTRQSSPQVCSICLEEITDSGTTPCAHTFDLTCIKRWLAISQACPLCKCKVDVVLYGSTGHLKYYPPKLRHKSVSGREFMANSDRARLRRQEEQQRRFQRRRRRDLLSASVEHDLYNDIALERRRFVYKHKLKSHHVGNNFFSNFKPFSLREFQANNERSRHLKSKATMFIRRELHVFESLASDNREFLLQYIIEGILTRLDIQSDSAHKLVADFLGPVNAEILLHELRTFLRSPFENLRGFDRSGGLIQYGTELKPDWHIT